MAQERYWSGPVKLHDDFGVPIVGTFIDGRTKQGPWAIMTLTSFKQHGVGLGTGLGQKYQIQEDRRWLKIEG